MSSTVVENTLTKTICDDSAKSGEMYAESSSGSENEWEGVDEEVSLSGHTLCLFCSETFETAEKMFDHCRSQHSFDIVSFSKRIGLNCITYIKLINYLRVHKTPSSELMEVSKANSPWIKDEYMKPHDAADSLLTFDIEGFVREKLSEQAAAEEDVITLPRARFEAILQKLAYKEMKLQNAYDRIDRMKEAAKTVLLCNNEQCSGANNRSQNQESKRSGDNHDDDHYYFSTYDHFAIHHEMLQDKVRTKAYEEAILQNPDVFCNKRVLDVGCGTGILSLFAAKAGASHIMGVDKSDVIFQAMDIVKENGYDSVLDFFKGRVEDMNIPENKYDVIVSEWMGYFLLFEGMMDSVIYARDKFLVPGGRIFPNRCTLSLVAVSDVAKYKEFVGFWDDVYGFKMTVMKKDVVKEANIETVKSQFVCSEPVVVKELDLCQCSVSDTEFSTPFDFKMSCDSQVTAIIGYFDCFFDEGLNHKVTLSTSPFSPTTHWKQTMFLFPKTVQVIEGEVINCRISCRKNRRDPRSLIIKINFKDLHNEYFLS